jgi:Zn-dependent metalloprotease
LKTKNFLRAYALTASLLMLLATFSCNRRETSQTNQAGGPSRTPDQNAPQKPPDPQTQTKEFEAQYKVKPVEPPPLVRPPVEAARESLPRGSGGELPTFDGEPFQINLSADAGRGLNEGNAGALINQVLGAFGWRRSPDEIRPAGKTSAPGARAEAVEAEIRRARAEDEKRLTGRLGRLSDATKKALDERAEQLRAAAARAQNVVNYDQRVDGVRVEHSGLQLAFQPDRGLAFVKGRVFNDVNVKNQRRLDEAAAAKAAADYVGRYTKVVEQQQPAAPELVILPYGDAMRFAWRVDVAAEEGTYRLWLDAESGDVLELQPQFWPDSATGLVFNPNPTAGTDTKSFDVNAPSGGNYRLVSGREDANNSGADGVSSGDVTVAAGGSGSADFNVSPLNGTAVQRTSDAGYNSRFQEVNAYAWVAFDTKYVEDWGSLTIPNITVTVNNNNPCGFGLNNACNNGNLIMGVGSATTSSSTSANALFNSAIDATVVTHEFGHTITPTQMAAGATLTAAANEGMSDYWAATIHNNPTFGGWWSQNQGAPVQTGFVPRQAETFDVFPEHRAFSTDGHADGQIIDWALWSTRSGMLSKGALGAVSLDSNLLKALNTYGVGLANSSTDKGVHDAFLDVLRQLAPRFSTSSEINKLMAGFARAGIHLSARDAVIDIGDDFLARGDATGPTFTVWGGRDYTFNAAGTASSSTDFNTRYEIEVANDAAFTVNHVTSGVLTGIAVNAQGTPAATWTLPNADWNTLKAADALYYRVTTTDGGGGNSRSSLQPGNNFLGTAVPAPSATINESGQCECNCSAAAALPTAKSTLSWAVLLPPLAALVWRRRSRGRAAR